jgi:hypothetical protein
MDQGFVGKLLLTGHGKPLISTKAIGMMASGTMMCATILNHSPVHFQASGV